MSVTKLDSAEVYSVKNNYEFATIVVRCWDDERDGKPWYRGELLINSSFGAWANYWNAPGIPFKQFLVSLDFHYLFTKLMGTELEVYDGDGTVKDLKKRLLEMRRKRQLNSAGAKWLWGEIQDSIDRMEASKEGFIEACSAISKDVEESWNRELKHDIQEIVELLADPWYQTKDKDHPQAVGFWREIWPEFVEALKTELTQPQP